MGPELLHRNYQRPLHQLHLGVPVLRSCDSVQEHQKQEWQRPQPKLTLYKKQEQKKARAERTWHSHKTCAGVGVKAITPTYRAWVFVRRESSMCSSFLSDFFLLVFRWALNLAPLPPLDSPKSNKGEIVALALKDSKQTSTPGRSSAMPSEC
mmetsp:Transcript_22452/g.45069  ORF Transcript_22452/g.45069 Transcript_22452/m.45069 type:complete len:152 (-) Transcript_22452:735-1190(-)